MLYHMFSINNPRSSRRDFESVLIESMNETDTTEAEEDLSQSSFYTILVPVLILACGATFILNLVIVLSYPFIRNLSKV